LEGNKIILINIYFDKNLFYAIIFIFE